MVFEIGVNLRVTECLDKGNRNYMEDFSKCYFEKVDGSIVFGFFAIFDGHGGSEAANFAKKNLINEIKKVPSFWSENDEEVLLAIKQGFINTHHMMWKERGTWSKTVSGFDSTAGTTATIAIVRNRKLYIGHVGDSACVLGFSKVMLSRTDIWDSVCMTVEHKPSNIIERKRIEKFGGTLAKKSGVQRVVWSRPKLTNPRQDLVEGDSIEYEQVPFLAVTRSLGDLWSYDQNQDVYHISPEPDVQCISLNILEHRCLILGSDGLWNVVPIQAAIELVRICERETERRVFLDPNVNSSFFYNPAASLVKYSISQWKRRGIRADNVSALVIMIDPPGPSMTKRREDRRKSNFAALDILSALTCEIPTNENFSKELTKEFLIECSRWRSANEIKNETEIEKSVDSQSKTSKETECELNDSFCLSNSSHKSLKNKTSIDIPKKKISDNASQNAITSDSFYLKYCISWINNSKMWAFISDYFQSKGLTNKVDIIHFMNEMDPRLPGEILRIMPWIFVANNTFKSHTQTHKSLSTVPLFNKFWVELYQKYIKQLEKSCLTIQFSNMQTIVSILKPNILSLLKQYNYLISPLNCGNSITQCGKEENNKNNEILLKSTRSKHLISDSIVKNKKHFNLLKVSDNTNLKILLNSDTKHGIPKIERFVQSDKKSQQKNEILLKRSISDKQVAGTPRLIKSSLSQFGIIQDSFSVYKQIQSNPNFRRRYSTMNTSNTEPQALTLNTSNSNSIHFIRNSSSIFDIRISQKNQNNLAVEPLRSVSAISNKYSSSFFRGKYDRNFSKFSLNFQ